MWIPAILILVIAFLYVLALCGRRGHPGLLELRKWRYAHRGLHDNTKPENSMAAFRAAVDAGFGIELDVHLLSDGELAVIHDSLLLRVTGKEGRVEDLTAADLVHYHLQGTTAHIPLLKDVLSVVHGKVPLIVEVKSVGNNYAAVTEKTCQLLESYAGPYCIESFDPRCVRWLRKNRPQVIRGQLAENFMKSRVKAPWILRFVLTHQLMNFLSRPDFIAYRYCDRKTLENFLCRKLWGLQGVTWTLDSVENYHTAVKEDWIPIFEGFIPDK